MSASARRTAPTKDLISLYGCFSLKRSALEMLPTNAYTRLDRRTSSTPVEISGKQIFEFCERLFAPRLQRHRITFGASAAFKRATLRSFPSAIYPVFVNLIDNAIYKLQRNRGANLGPHGVVQSGAPAMKRFHAAKTRSGCELVVGVYAFWSLLHPDSLTLKQKGDAGLVYTASIGSRSWMVGQLGLAVETCSDQGQSMEPQRLRDSQHRGF